MLRTVPLRRTAWKRRAPRKPARTTQVDAYWNLLRGMGCMVTGLMSDLTIHHCHSGSMAERGVNRGGGEKVSDWLVIPLNLYLHSMGPNAIDGACGVLTWELRYGRQADFIDLLVEQTGVDVWALAGVTELA